MAKKDQAKTSGGAEAQLERMRNGLQVEAGWCVDFDRNPAVFECDEELSAVAAGDLSRSYDGKTVSMADTGEVIKGVNRSGLVASIPATPAGAVPAATATSDSGGGAGGGATSDSGGGRTTNP